MLFIDGYLYYQYTKTQKSVKDTVVNIKNIDTQNGLDLSSMEKLMVTSFENDKAKSRYWAEKAHSRGSLLATNNLAIMYLYGLGGDKNISKAILLFKESANNGSVIGIKNLGFIYLNSNRGIDKNKGFQYLSQACNMGDKESCLQRNAIKKNRLSKSLSQ